MTLVPLWSVHVEITSLHLVLECLFVLLSNVHNLCDKIPPTNSWAILVTTTSTFALGFFKIYMHISVGDSHWSKISALLYHVLGISTQCMFLSERSLHGVYSNGYKADTFPSIYKMRNLHFMGWLWIISSLPTSSSLYLLTSIRILPSIWPLPLAIHTSGRSPMALWPWSCNGKEVL